ncbi:hypothetical protein LR010_01920 [Candidatus Gracilibacteria bacterium]|nr:hypothetical protein [Candidatus Gracilibacteria bacterium]
MTTIEVEIPKELEKTFKSVEKKISTQDFLLGLQEAEEELWVDYKLDQPMPMKEFADILRKDIYGS